MLLQATNGHISRGGEFEKRAAFVNLYNLPGETVGLGHTPKGLLVWGHETRPSELPPEIQYQQLVHPLAPATKIRTINSYALFKSKVYVSATFEDGDVYHYYNGVRVVDWDYGCARVQFKVTGGHNIVAKAASAGFVITGGTNAVANQITGVFVNGVKITQRNVQHDGSHKTTAQKVAAEINRFTSSPNYNAAASDNGLFVVAAATGAGPNGMMVTVTVTGNVTTTAPVLMAGGVTASVSRIDLSVAGVDLMARTDWKTSNSATAKAVVAAINAFHGVRDYHATWDGNNGVSVVADQPGVGSNGLVLVPALTNGFTITPTSTLTFAGGVDPPADPDAPTNLPYLPGDFVITHDSKMYALSGSTMYFSKIDDPTKWRDPETNVGAGFKDMSAQASNSEELMAIAKYQNYVAVFAYSTILIWFTDPDPDLTKLSQVLHNTGTRSPRSVVQFSDNDVYYLNESGIRSLRARDSSNSASTTDVGVLIDPLVIEKLQTLTFDERLKCFGLIEPVDGRFWLTMGDTIFVFSYFAGAKVSAWSVYIPSFPDAAEGGEFDNVFNIDEAIVFRRRVYIRSGDSIHCYGGEDATFVYDRTEAIMQTPYLDANVPAKEKSFQGWDAAVRGVWEVSASMDPTNLDAVDLLGVIDESTFPHNRMGMNAQATHVSLRFKTRSAERAVVGNGLIHFTSDGEEDGTR